MAPARSIRWHRSWEQRSYPKRFEIRLAKTKKCGGYFVRIITQGFHEFICNVCVRLAHGDCLSQTQAVSVPNRHILCLCPTDIYCVCLRRTQTLPVSHRRRWCSSLTDTDCVCFPQTQLRLSPIEIIMILKFEVLSGELWPSLHLKLRDKDET